LARLRKTAGHAAADLAKTDDANYRCAIFAGHVYRLSEPIRLPE
jgi:hypothetical protein